jgi:hypothetical protein
MNGKEEARQEVPRVTGIIAILESLFIRTWIMLHPRALTGIIGLPTAAYGAGTPMEEWSQKS